ncbi:hypothetical protein [Gorillibacterium sp. sgz5001074]|uniref:hypothetical protein n=1 Tax=Gorillibacterium sp. sgz5001074 TaxID=3446695 RepID=UPI003F665B86
MKKKIGVSIAVICMLASPYFISRQTAISKVKRTNVNCAIEETTLYWFRLAPYWKITYKQQDSEKTVLLDVWGQYFAG